MAAAEGVGEQAVQLPAGQPGGAQGVAGTAAAPSVPSVRSTLRPTVVVGSTTRPEQVLFTGPGQVTVTENALFEGNESTPGPGNCAQTAPLPAMNANAAITRELRLLMPFLPHSL